MPLVLTYSFVTFDGISYDRNVEKVPVGKRITCDLHVRAEYPRGPLGLISPTLNSIFMIKYDDTLCVSRVNRKFTGADITDKITCSFVMPNKKTNVIFSGGHEEKGKWVEDFRKIITLSPPPPPAVKPAIIKCQQRFKVIDEKGIPIGGATVRIVGIGIQYTDAAGITIRGLDEGKEYSIEAEKSGYECVDCKKVITACTPTIVLTLKARLPPPPAVKPAIAKCQQRFKVMDEMGGPISAAIVRIVGIGIKYTDASGMTSVELEEGKEYTIEAVKSGYEGVDFKRTFTACTPTIALTLKAPPPPAVKPAIKKCQMRFKVTNEKGEPIGAATVIIVGIGKKFTDSSGMTSVDLEEGEDYTVTAEKEGYGCIDCRRIFVACTPTITLTLTEVPVEVLIPRGIYQFKVVDEEGKPLEGARLTLITDKEIMSTVRVKKEGLWATRLAPDRDFRVIADKVGYECVECEKTFTTTKEGGLMIVLTLRKVK